MNRVTVDPISNQQFMREIIRKLPREMRGILICDRERPVSDFTAKVAEIMIESDYIKSDSSYKSKKEMARMQIECVLEINTLQIRDF